MISTKLTKTHIVHRRGSKTWELRDDIGYLIDQESTPAAIRLAKRRWYLFLTIQDADLGWKILTGEVELK